MKNVQSPQLLSFSQYPEKAQYNKTPTQDDSITIPSQLYSEQLTASNENVYYTLLDNSPDQAYSMLQTLPAHPDKFFYQPPGDPFNYHIKCEKVSKDSLNKSINMQLKENEYVFFYLQLSDCQSYQITCELVTPSSINNYLNFKIYGIEMNQVTGHEEISLFTIYQKENLKWSLTQYLTNFLLN
ncbi:hypothetical protein C1645_736005 [Glomus cerebriforme]|uniref:Uncharacterized protein n=1 Tax=Glomus cerebriforme TaxID=658196 RepID=A0A397T415_9GLOM|nr:hypothetical protein C1645_736005 [Glomus cerebriforme]